MAPQAGMSHCNPIPKRLCVVKWPIVAHGHLVLVAHGLLLVVAYGLLFSRSQWANLVVAHGHFVEVVSFFPCRLLVWQFPVAPITLLTPLQPA